MRARRGCLVQWVRVGSNSGTGGTVPLCTSARNPTPLPCAVLALVQGPSHGAVTKSRSRWGPRVCERALPCLHWRCRWPQRHRQGHGYACIRTDTQNLLPRTFTALLLLPEKLRTTLARITDANGQYNTRPGNARSIASKYRLPQAITHQGTRRHSSLVTRIDLGGALLVHWRSSSAQCGE